MQIEQYQNYPALSKAVANAMMDTIRSKNNALICVATGNTPIGPYKHFVEMVKETGLDCSKVRFVGLDEWLGLSPENEGTCHHFLHQHLFHPLQISPWQYRLFKGLATQPEAECKAMNDFLDKEGPIDLLLLGIGMNGHLGFNEPGTPWHYRSHVIYLSETTQVVGQQYFNQPMELKQGITLGPADLVQAKKILLMANGSHKQAIVNRLLEEEAGINLPASLLKNLEQAHLMTDLQMIKSS
jgi:glucosamine-6-phosphate isomerase